MTDIVRINSTIFSWTSTSFKFDGIPYIGILSFEYEQTLERTPIQSDKRDARPLGFSCGAYGVRSMSMKMLRDSWDILSKQLAATALSASGSYGGAEFTLIVQYVEPFLRPITVACVGCKVASVKPTLEEGTGAATVDLEFDCLEIVENGLTLADQVSSL